MGACMVILTFAAITTNTAGSAMCPAAMSSTIYTWASMFFGYLAQTILFAMAPDLVTLMGAALMLAAVVIMASARLSKALPGDDAQHEHMPDSANSTTDTMEANDGDTESLASFASSEFAMWAPHEKSVRQRFTANNVTEVSAQKIGAASVAL